MNQARRQLLRGAFPSAALTVALAAGILRPAAAHAFGMAAGRDSGLAQTLRALQGSNPALSGAILINAPDIAENGASVFLRFACVLPDVDTLVVFVDRNPQPLVAAFHLAPEVVPDIQMRIKVAETARVWVVARSAGQFYKAFKAVQVTIGGCGAGVN